MLRLVLLVGSIFLLGSALLGAAPPSPVPAAAKKYIEQLADDDADVRQEPMKRLEATGEDIVPALRATGGSRRRRTGVAYRGGPG
jgi:hypothetical protein